MVGSGDMDAGKIGAKRSVPGREINIKKSQEETQKPSVDKKAKFEKTSSENRSVFNKPSESQNIQANKEGSKLSGDKDNQLTKKSINQSQKQKYTPSGLNKDYEVKNIKTRADLESLDIARRPKADKPRGADDKKKPPKMSLRTKLMPKRPINPKRPLPAIPGRLKSTTVNDPKKQLQEAVNILNAREAYQDPNLISQYAKKLLNSGIDIKNKSIANLFGFDESIADMDLEALKAFADSSSKSELSDELKLMLRDSFNQIFQSDTQQIKPFIQLFFPFPVPYMFLEIDDEFWRDDDELLEDEFEEDEESDEDSEEEDEEEDFVPDTEAKISINTINYGKLHIHLAYSASLNKFELSVKGDEIAQELVDIVESSLSLDMGDSEFVQDELRLWHDNVLRITESRTLQIVSEGQLDSVFLKACNIILKSIADNDKGPKSKNIDAEYKIL